MSYFGLWGFEHVQPGNYSPTSNKAFLDQISGARIVANLANNWHLDTLAPQQLYVASEVRDWGNIRIIDTPVGRVMGNNYNSGGSGITAATSAHAKWSYLVYRPENNSYGSTPTSVITAGIRISRSGSRPEWIQQQGLVVIRDSTGVVWDAGVVAYPDTGFLEVTIDISSGTVTVWVDNVLIDTYTAFVPGEHSVYVYDAALLQTGRFDYCLSMVGGIYLKVDDQAGPTSGRLGPITCKLLPLSPATGEWSDTAMDGTQLSALVGQPLTTGNYNTANNFAQTAPREKPVHFELALPAGTVGLGVATVNNRASDANILEEFILDIDTSSTSLSVVTEVAIAPLVQLNTMGRLVPLGTTSAKFSIRSLRKPN